MRPTLRFRTRHGQYPCTTVDNRWALWHISACAFPAAHSVAFGAVGCSSSKLLAVPTCSWTPSRLLDQMRVGTGVLLGCYSLITTTFTTTDDTPDAHWLSRVYQLLIHG